MSDDEFAYVQVPDGWRESFTICRDEDDNAVGAVTIAGFPANGVMLTVRDYATYPPTIVALSMSNNSAYLLGFYLSRLAPAHLGESA